MGYIIFIMSNRPILRIGNQIAEDVNVGNNKTDATMYDSFLKQIWMLQTNA